MPIVILDTDFDKADAVVAQLGTSWMHQAVAKAIAEERERCAQVAEHLNGWGHPIAPKLAHHIAKIIRQG